MLNAVVPEELGDGQECQGTCKGTRGVQKLRRVLSLWISKPTKRDRDGVIRVLFGRPTVWSMRGTKLGEYVWGMWTCNRRGSTQGID